MQSVQQSLVNNQFYSCDNDSKNDGGNKILNADSASEGRDASLSSGEDADSASEGHDASLSSGGENCSNIENISVDDELFEVCMLIYDFTCIFVFAY